MSIWDDIKAGLGDAMGDFQEYGREFLAAENLPIVGDLIGIITDTQAIHSGQVEIKVDGFGRSLERSELRRHGIRPGRFTQEGFWVDKDDYDRAIGILRRRGYNVE